MTDIINLRLTVIEKQRLTAIARSMGLSLSAFLRMAAVKEAHKILGTKHDQPCDD